MKFIPLTQGKVAIVDDEDYENLSKFKWYYGGSGYAVRNIPLGPYKQTQERMHRVILGAPNGMDVDHINHDPLDNQRSNLRLCTRSQNAMNGKLRKTNKHGLKGVYFNKRLKKFCAQISKEINGKRKTIYLGLFPTAHEAHAAYAKAAPKLHGEFARLA